MCEPPPCFIEESWGRSVQRLRVQCEITAPFPLVVGKMHQGILGVFAELVHFLNKKISCTHLWSFRVRSHKHDRVKRPGTVLWSPFYDSLPRHFRSIRMIFLDHTLITVGQRA